MTSRKIFLTLAAAAAAALTLCLFLAIFSLSRSAFADEGDGDEIEYTYDEETGKWLYPIAEKVSVSNNLGNWSVYLCFDERPGGDCPQSSPIYFDTYPVGVLVDWPSCLTTNTTFYSPGVSKVRYIYGEDSMGLNLYEYLVGSASSSDVTYRQSSRYADNMGDRLYAEITKREEYSRCCVKLTAGDYYGVSSVGSTKGTKDISSSRFAVDLTAPEIESESGRMRSVSVTATDEVSGIECVFVKGPGDESFSVAAECGGATSATVSVEAGEDGEYQFFASDMCGNCSDVYSVYLDTSAPILTVEESEECFILSASDDGGAAYILDEDGNAHESPLSVPKDFVGTKVFWAVDEAGNVSDPLEITITLMWPEGLLYETDDEGYAFTWDDPGGIAMLDGEPYEKDTVVTKEGNHLLEFQTSEGEVFSYEFEVGHFYYESYREDATCQAEGYVRYDCAHCDDFYTETLEKLEHSFYSYEASATCEEGGYIRYTCMYCGESYTFETSSATGHVYLPATSTATCTSPGGTTYTCMRCGDSYVVGDGVLAEHEYVTEEIVSPTCESAGYRVLVCCNCGDERRDAIAATGHEWYLASETKDSEGSIVRTYRCSMCGDARVQTLGDTADSAAQAIVSLFESYSKYMWWALLAVAAVWGAFLGIRYAVTADDEGHAKARRAVWNFAIGLVVIAVILVAVPYLVYGLALLLA